MCDGGGLYACHDDAVGLIGAGAGGVPEYDDAAATRACDELGPAYGYWRVGDEAYDGRSPAPPYPRPRSEP